MLDKAIESLYKKLRQEHYVGFFSYNELMNNLHVSKSDVLVYSIDDIAIVAGKEDDIKNLQKAMHH